jgi:uncharacterized protein YbaP (TraB family)
MRRHLLLIAFLFLVIFAQGQKKYPALLWKITGNGLTKPSYLYGTMHVSNRVAYYLSEQFFEALKSADVVGLETNPAEWLENMERTGELDALRSANQSENLNFYRSAFTISFPEKRILQGILSYDPDIINGLLYRQNQSKENFEESTYIDLFIFQSASKLNKEVISLENFAQAEIKARLSALPDEEAREMDNSAANFYTNAQKIEDAYREGNLDMIDSLSKLGTSRNMQRFLINDRNVFFVKTIDSVLKKKSLFSGIGAAHLPGEDGVIELLRQKGYNVEPVIPRVTKKSNNMREALDQQVKPVTFKKQFVSDSAFSLNLPGKLYPIVDIGNIKYYIHPDMVNGNFYSVVRLKHLGPVFGIQPSQMKARMDSLLFEHIPGKIISRKDISINGIEGIEVVNRTRRGDEQHYQIYFSDLELYLFKLGGKGKYAGGNEAKQFFNSIRFVDKPSTPVMFSPPTKGFKVKLPSNYSYTKHEGASITGLVEDLFAFNKTTNEGFGVRRAVYNDFNYLEEDTFELNQFARNILLNYGFKGSSEKPGVELGFPCIRFSGKNAFSNLYGKVYIKGVHYYFIYHFTGKESGFNNEFFNSFSLEDFEYTNPIKEITDKDFYFKAKDEVSDNAYSRFNEAYVKAYEESRTKKVVNSNQFDYRTSTKYYYSPSSNEYVNITFEKYNDYDYRDPSEIDKTMVESIQGHTGGYIASRSFRQKEGVSRHSYIIKDTATARALAVKIFFKEGLMHEVSAPFDTTIGLRGWTKGFMDSFYPLDTVIGKNIFQNKFGQLLEALASKDTTIRSAANISIRSIGIHKKNADEFVKFISGPLVPKVSEDSRAQLFVMGGTIQSDNIIGPYRSLYKQYTDSFYLQLCLLKGLALHKTTNSYKAFYDLVTTETPLVGEESTINDVFANLHDSLILCKNFFPGILSLTKYDEYRNPVYALLADLVNRNLLPPQNYQSQKDKILEDANLTLKRFAPTVGKNNSEQGQYDDKNVREIAEIIKGNLEALATNNLYRNSSYLKAMENFNRAPLVNYAYVLAPFYKNDEKTKQFFTKLSKIKLQNIAMPVTINLLKYDIVLNDTLVSHYSRNKFTRAYFYSELEKEGLTSRFDKQYLSQSSLNESVLLSQKQLTSAYLPEKEKQKKDSLILIKEISAKNKYQSGKMYIYKHAKGRHEDEQWSAVFISTGDGPVTSRIELVNSEYYPDYLKTQDENINELLDQFSLQYRKRAAVNNKSYEQ